MGRCECAAGFGRSGGKNRFPGIMSDCTGRSSPMISNWVGKRLLGINELRGGWLTATRYLWTSVQCGFPRWESARSGGSYKEYIPLDGHYVRRPLKTARPLVRPDQGGVSLLVWLIGRGNYSRKKKEAGSDTDTL